MDIRYLSFPKQVKQQNTFLRCVSKYGLYFLHFLAFILIAAYTIQVSAHEPTTKGKWSLETSLTFPPAAQIYMLKLSVGISHNSELGSGPAFQNWKNTNKEPMGQANAYTLLLSYRYFFWKNFNVELELWPAYNHFYL